MGKQKFETLTQAVKRVFGISMPELLIGRMVTFSGKTAGQGVKTEYCGTIVAVAVESVTSSHLHVMLSGGWKAEFPLRVKPRPVTVELTDSIFKRTWYGKITLHP